MAKIASNRPLFWTLIANVIYIIAGSLTPNPYVSSASSLLLLISSSVMFFRYAPTAWQIVVHGLRDSEERGSHLGVYGATLVAAGSCYVGLFGLLWVLAGQPTDWLGTAISGYGRGVSAIGFALMAYSPDTKAQGVSLPNVLMMVLLIVVVAVASFFVGTRAAPDQAVYWQSISGKFADRPSCPPDREVWGSSSHIYHKADSPYRGMVQPERCFKTVDEARKKGFQPPK